MIRSVIAWAGAGFLVASPALAAGRRAELSGAGELAATYLNLDDGGKNVIQGGEASDYWLLGGGGSLDVAWHALNLQADLAAEGKLDEGSADDTYEHSVGGGLHVGWRDPDRGTFGAFGGVGEVAIHDADDNDPDTVAWGVGLEGQAFFDRLTLYLQAGYLDRESVARGGDVDAIKNAGFGRVVGRYFWTDDFKLESELSYTQGTMDPDEDDVGILGWGAELEYRPGRFPVSGFVGYTGARYYQKDDWDALYEHRIGFGLRVYFGQPSLLAHDRRGASLHLPRYLEWNGQAAGALE